MRKSLLKRVSEVKKDAKKLGFTVDVNPTMDDNSVILANKDAKKIVILGEVQMFGQDITVAYQIHIKQWLWAEMEGFSKEEIMTKMANRVFSEISVDEIAKNLL